VRGRNNILDRDWDERLTRRLEGFARDLQSRVSLWCWEQFVVRTPVFTPKPGDPPGYPTTRGGDARLSWFISADDPGNAGPATNEAAAQARARSAVETLRNFREIHITNNAPYIGVLEFGEYPNPPKAGTGRTVGGYSTQAPRGMVRATIGEVPKAAEAIARELFMEAFRR
jgi:hypothetical protein